MKEVINFAPDIYQEALYKALDIQDSYKFIDEYSGVACGIKDSIPLIFHIVYHSNSWEEGIVLNATLGGASSARGIFVSALLSMIYGIPSTYLDKLYYKI